MGKNRSRRELEPFIDRARALARPWRVAEGSRFNLSQVDPQDTGPFGSDDKKEAQIALAQGVETLAGMQDRLWAQDRWALLLIFQAMDAAGKDGAIKHVMSGVNPQGCQVTSFKTPSAEELDHDFLWRCQRCLPERGRIGIFNRSYYEEVLVVRVHPEMLARQRLPQALIGPEIWQQRFEDIRGFERCLARNGIVVRKFFLHLSPEEQRRRFLERIDDPAKQWKFSPSDVAERQLWTEYQRAYEDTIRNTATEQAPWHVIPADHKWFTRLVVASVVVEALADLDLHYPTPDEATRAGLAEARALLMREDDSDK